MPSRKLVGPAHRAASKARSRSARSGCAAAAILRVLAARYFTLLAPLSEPSSPRPTDSARARIARDSQDNDHDHTAEESRPCGPAIARPRTHPPHPAVLRAAIPTSMFLLARCARCVGFLSGGKNGHADTALTASSHAV
ncbi:MAG TPA: hypothetical protein VFJ06_14255 [Halococcus sp.]|nr:hypothetical protein [Halococcus sp.]